jgi:hypothetical protein
MKGSDLLKPLVKSVELSMLFISPPAPPAAADQPIPAVMTQALPTLNTAIPSFPVAGTAELRGSASGVLNTTPVSCAASPCKVQFSGMPTLDAYLKKEKLTVAFTPKATVAQTGLIPATGLSDVTAATFTFPDEFTVV